MAKFEKNNKMSKGRPKGATNLRTRELQDKINDIVNNQTVNIIESMDKLARQNPSLYLKSIADVLPYVMPRLKDDISIQTDTTEPITYNVSFGGLDD